MHIDFARLRGIPIVQVANALGMQTAKVGFGIHAMKEENGEVTSLIMFTKTNTWKRFSGKERSGISRGSPIDLVMHIRECPLMEAVQFLTARFL